MGQNSGLSKNAQPQEEVEKYAKKKKYRKRPLKTKTFLLVVKRRGRKPREDVLLLGRFQVHSVADP